MCHVLFSDVSELMVAVEDCDAATMAKVKECLERMDFKNGNISPDIFASTIVIELAGQGLALEAFGIASKLAEKLKKLMV